MPISTTKDLFLYELGIMRDIEDAGRELLRFLALQVRNSDLAQILRTHQEDTDRHLRNIRSCLQALGVSPLETPSEIVGGIRRRFEAFVQLAPTPEMLDQFAIDTAIRYMRTCIAGYITLLDWAILMAETECVQYLHANLIEEQESTSRLERFSHEMGTRLLAPT